jgi:hypothetical protein
LPGVPVLARSDIWLGTAPAGQHTGAWTVVCLTALTAMDCARRQMVKRMLAGQSAGPHLVCCLQRFAIAKFWELLADFCAVDAPPESWRHELPSNHPFFRFDSQASQWSVRLD